MEVTVRGKMGLNCTAAVLNYKGMLAKMLNCKMVWQGLHFKRESCNMDAHFKMEIHSRESWEGHIIPTSWPVIVLFRNTKPLMQSKSKLIVKYVRIWFCKSEEKFMARDASTSDWATAHHYFQHFLPAFGIVLLLSLSFPPKVIFSLLTGVWNAAFLDVGPVGASLLRSPVPVSWLDVTWIWQMGLCCSCQWLLKHVCSYFKTQLLSCSRSSQETGVTSLHSCWVPSKCTSEVSLPASVSQLVASSRHMSPVLHYFVPCFLFLDICWRYLSFMHDTWG